MENNYKAPGTINKSRQTGRAPSVGTQCTVYEPYVMTVHAYHTIYCTIIYYVLAGKVQLQLSCI